MNFSDLLQGMPRLVTIVDSGLMDLQHYGATSGGHSAIVTAHEWHSLEQVKAFVSNHPDVKKSNRGFSLDGWELSSGHHFADGSYRWVLARKDSR